MIRFASMELTPAQPLQTVDEGVFWRPEDFSPGVLPSEPPVEQEDVPLPESTLEGLDDLLSMSNLDYDGNPVLLSERMPLPFQITPAMLAEARNMLYAERAKAGHRLNFKVALAGTLGMIMAMTPYSARPIADILRAPTPTEITVETLTERALGNSIILRCLPQPELDARPSGDSPYAPDKAGKTWRAGFELMWVEESLCEALEEFANDPVSHEQAMQDDAARERLEYAALAASVIAHEFAHTLGVVKESDAECASVELTPLILEAAGANATPEFVNFVTAVVIEESDKTAKDHPEYSLDPTCRAGL